MRGTLIAANRTRALDHEASLSAHAAWLYLCGHMTQRETAKRLGVPSTKAHRLIARATREGVVRIVVDASVFECVELEESLTRQPRLALCRVSPDLGEGHLPIRTLGLTGTNFLHDALERQLHRCIGVGQGRTLSSKVGALPTMHRPDMSFVSPIGDQSHVAVSFAGQTIVVVEHERSRIHSGADVSLAIKAADLHVFDSLSGAALSHGGELA